MLAVRQMGVQATDLPRSFRGLPATVTATIRALQLEEAEAAASARVVGDQLFHLRQAREDTAKRLADLKRSVAQGVLTPADKGAEIARLESDIAETVNAIEKLELRFAVLSANAANAQALLRSQEKYARASLSGGKVVHLAPPAETPELKKHETYADAIEKRRRRGRELRADVDKYRAAPVPSSVVIQGAIDEIEALASRGAPDAFNAIERGGSLEWPTFHYKNFTSAGRIEFQVADTLPIIAHLLKPQMIAAAKAAIEAAADDEAALSADDRARLIAEAERDALAVEREEVALIRAAKAAGQPAFIRPDTDPRAVLGLADDMPAPAQ